MKATMIGHDLINAGSAKYVVVGGMESMSNAWPSPFSLAACTAAARLSVLTAPINLTAVRSRRSRISHGPPASPRPYEGSRETVARAAEAAFVRPDVGLRR